MSKIKYLLLLVVFLSCNDRYHDENGKLKVKFDTTSIPKVQIIHLQDTITIRDTVLIHDTVYISKKEQYIATPYKVIKKYNGDADPLLRNYYLIGIDSFFSIKKPKN